MVPWRGENRPKMDLGASVGRSWGLLGLLVGSWVDLGALLERSWGVPGGSWCRLGASWAAPGPLLGLVLGSRGAFLEAFKPFLYGSFAKREKHEKCRRYNVFRGFLRSRGLKIHPKWLQNRVPEAPGVSGRPPARPQRPRRPPGGSQEAPEAGNHVFYEGLGGPGAVGPGSGVVIVTRFGPGGEATEGGKLEARD